MRKEFIEVKSEEMADLMNQVKVYDADMHISVYPDSRAKASEKLQASQKQLRELEMECDDYDLLPEVKAEAIRKSKK